MEATDSLTSNRPFRVLSLDGGGMRGLYSAKVLQTLAARFNPEVKAEELDLGRSFNLIVGTSTGGILACALAAGIPISRIESLYREHGPRIFNQPMPRKKLPLLGWIFRNLGKAANNQSALREALEGCFGSATILDLWDRRRIALCIPTVDMMTQKAWVFKTPHDPKRQRDNRYRLVDVCLATSAAPLYLPIAVIENPASPGTHQFFVDGGLWANNPMLVGLVEALQLAGEHQPIEILSVSTCAPPEGASLTKEEADWGVQKWKVGSGALSSSLDAQSSGHDFIGNFLVPHLNKKVTIFRLPPSSPSSEQASHMALDMTSPKTINTLCALADHDANMIYGRILQEDNPKYRLVRETFSHLQPY